MVYQLTKNEFSLDMNSCDTQFDQELLKIPHYQYHPEMLPFVGKNYCNKKKRVLLVGESHYLTHTNERDISADYVALNWYETPLFFNDTNNVFCKDFRNYTTRGVLRSFVESEKDGSGWIMFSNPIRAYYNEDYINHHHIHDFAFVNFYQRPAFEFGKSINTTTEERKLNLEEQDHRVACETLNAVIDVILPDIVIFLSRKAYGNFICKKTVDIYRGPHPTYCWWKLKTKNKTVDIYRVPHPTCCWWNRKTKNNTKGKDTFKQILIDAWGQV